MDEPTPFNEAPSRAALRAVLYVRLSKEDRRGKTQGLDSIAIQTANGTQALQEQGWTLVEVVTDDDWSGGRADRPGLLRVMELARQGFVDVVAMRRLDRLSRMEAARTMGLLVQLHDLGVRAWDFSSRRFVGISGTEGLVSYVGAMQAEGERLATSERTRAALAARRRDGRRVNRSPMGYSNAGAFYAVDPEGAERLREIARIAIAAGSVHGGVRELNRRGVPSRKGTGWGCSALRLVLSRPLYRGIYTYQGESQLKPELRIFDEETCTRIDALLHRKAKPWASTRRHLSTGLVRCSICGASLVCQTSRLSGASLTCPRAAKNDPRCKRASGGGLGFKSERMVDAAVLSACNSLVDENDLWPRVREILAELLEQQRVEGEKTANVAQLKRELRKARRNAQNAREMALDSETVQERNDHRASLRTALARVSALETELQRAESSPHISVQDALAEADARVAELRETLAKGGPEARPALEAVLGDHVFDAEREPDGAWTLTARVDARGLLPGPTSARLMSASGRSSDGRHQTQKAPEKAGSFLLQLRAVA